MMWRSVGLAVAVAAAAAEFGVGAASGATYTRSTGFAVTTPTDATTVRGQFLLRWTALPGISRYAVVVDHSPVPPGQIEAADGHTIVVAGQTAVYLDLGPHLGGSPTAQPWHQVSVVPISPTGQRIGETVATIEVQVLGGPS